MRTLYLIRHGQPQVRETHTCGYAEDAPLSEAGRRQTGALAWTGLTFEEIKRRWPAEYARRGLTPSWWLPAIGERCWSAIWRA